MSRSSAVFTCQLHVLYFVLLVAVVTSVPVQVTSTSRWSGTLEGTDRPPYHEYAKRARYIVNRANWTVLATFSYHDPILGFPYARVESSTDGLLHKGKGTPYFYLMKDGTPMQNINKCNNVTLSYSEAEFNDIQSCTVSPSSDPENPLCSRLMLYGNIYEVTDKEELQMAKSMLFARHPIMKDFPSSHHFTVYGLKLVHIYLLDFYGGAVSIDVSDYFNA